MTKKLKNLPKLSAKLRRTLAFREQKYKQDCKVRKQELTNSGYSKLQSKQLAHHIKLITSQS